MAKSKYAKYIVTDLKAPDFNPEFITRYETFAKRILWMDDNVVPGSFQMNCSWYLKPNSSHLGTGPHKHKEGEIIGFFSSDPDKPYDLGAEIELFMGEEQEKFIITYPTTIYIPKGFVHCPLRFVKVDRPLLLVHASLAPEYKK